MLLYPDHVYNWLDFGYGLLIAPLWCDFNLVKRVEFEVSEHFHKKNMRRMAWNLVCWCILTTFTTGQSWSLIILYDV